MGNFVHFEKRQDFQIGIKELHKKNALFFQLFQVIERELRKIVRYCTSSSLIGLLPFIFH